ncbi:acyltransferase family protein [Streptomyces sp. NPDC048436]|uniref:acyltransferase family protein n=1 Tax=Streptomyces sp. NPDC048436 TaxID=3365550 RepID=UPI0037181EBB
MSSGHGVEPPRRDTLPSLTGLRWIAALLVFGLHFTALRLGTELGARSPAPFDRALYDLFRTGFIGVSFFFVLSGFVLTWSTPQGRKAGEFWRKRLAKIFPVYVVSSLAAALLLIITAQMWPSWRVVLAQVFMVQAWVPDQSYFLGINPVMWSLSCEAFFYLCFPALLLVLSRAATRTLWISAVVCVALTFVLPGLAGEVLALRTPEPAMFVSLDGFDNQFMYWFTYIFPPMRLTEFALGVIIALLIRRNAWSGPGVSLSLAICVVGFVLNRELPAHMQRAAGMLIPFALLIAALATADRAGKWTPFRGPRMVFLGKISFCFYAVHMLFVLHTRDRIRPWLVDLGLISRPDQALPVWANIGFFFGYLAAAALTAWALYRLVELPMTRVIRGRPPTPPPPGEVEVPAAREALPSSASHKPPPGAG